MKMCNANLCISDLRLQTRYIHSSQISQFLGDKDVSLVHQLFASHNSLFTLSTHSPNQHPLPRGLRTKSEISWIIFSLWALSPNALSNTGYPNGKAACHLPGLKFSSKTLMGSGGLGGAAASCLPSAAHRWPQARTGHTSSPAPSGGDLVTWLAA